MSEQGFTDGTEIRFRIDSLEKGHAQLSKDVKDGFEGIGRSIATLADKVNGTGKPNWQIVIAVASFCFMAITGFITVIKSPMESAIIELKRSAVEARQDRRDMLTKDDYRYERDRSFNLLIKRLDDQDNKFEIYRREHGGK